MKPRRSIHFHAALAGLVCMLAAGVSSAQQGASMPAGMHGMAGMSMRQPTPSGANPATQAYQAGGAKMMQDMDAPYSGDPDRDFVAHMIPHHEGAVSMAQVELRYGKDPALRKLAAGIIKAQDQEIAFMKKWQAQHGIK